MPKIKFLLLTFAIFSTLFFVDHNAQAATVTLDGSGDIITGDAISLNGSYTAAESPNTDREACFRAKRAEAGKTDFKLVTNGVFGCKDMIKDKQGSLEGSFYLMSAGDYRFELIRRVKDKPDNVKVLGELKGTVEVRDKDQVPPGQKGEQVKVNIGELNFPKTSPGKQATLSFTITNNRSADITIVKTGFQLTKLNADDQEVPIDCVIESDRLQCKNLPPGEKVPFEEVPFSNKTITANGGTKELSIAFKPEIGSTIKKGNYWVNFESVDKQPVLPLVIGLTADMDIDTGIKVEPASVEFGKKEVGKKHTQDLTITNNTADEIIFDFSLPVSDEFTKGKDRQTLSPTNKTGTLVITFAPTTEETKEAILKLLPQKVGTDGKTTPLTAIEVKITGQGCKAPCGDVPPGNGNVNGGTIPVKFPNPLGDDTKDITDLVRNIINGIFGLLGVIAVAMIVYGGFLYMVGGASKDGTEKAKKVITSAVIGLVIVLLSLAIVDLLFLLLGGR